MCFLFVFAAYALQSIVIYPLEALIRKDAHLDIVSLIYLPHGVEVILAVLVGPLAFVYIFFAQFLAGAIFFDAGLTNLIGSAIGGLAIVIPIILLNGSSKRTLLSAPVDYKTFKVSVVWTYLSISLFTALLDSAFHMKLYFSVADIDVFTYFIVGDVTGAIAVFMLFLFLYRPFLLKIVVGYRK